jgi:hypothetical protein
VPFDPSHSAQPPTQIPPTHPPGLPLRLVPQQRKLLGCAYRLPLGVLQLKSHPLGTLLCRAHLQGARGGSGGCGFWAPRTGVQTADVHTPSGYTAAASLVLLRPSQPSPSPTSHLVVAVLLPALYPHQRRLQLPHTAGGGQALGIRLLNTLLHCPAARQAGTERREQ